MYRKLYLLSVLAFIAVLFSSCSMEKRVYMHGYNIEFGNPYFLRHKARADKNQATYVNADANNNIITRDTSACIENSEMQGLASRNNNDILFNSASLLQQEISGITNYTFNDTCDNIILKTGEEIEAVVQEIDENNIKYTKCDNLTGPVYVVPKSKVFMIKYVNGTKDVFKEEQKTKGELKTTQKLYSKRVEGFGVPALSIALSSLLVWAFISMLVGLAGAIIAAVFGFISLGRIKKYPERYKGKGNGITGIVLCALIIVLTLLILSSL